MVNAAACQVSPRFFSLNDWELNDREMSRKKKGKKNFVGFILFFFSSLCEGY